jgi:subtilisin family serine protease
MVRPALFLLLSVFFTGVSGQSRLIREESVPRRMEVIRSLPEDPEKARALQLAARKGLSTRHIHPDGRIVEIRRLNPNGQPEYLATRNLNAARTISTNKVWLDGGAGLDLSGEGIVVGVWDGGVLRSTHQEFGDRGRILDPMAEVADHSTHVSGTVGAEGIVATARGMANRVIIEGYDWNNDLDEMEAAAGEGLLISNHSYGYVVGWDYNSDDQRWEWYGDTDVSEEEDYLFGYYMDEAQEYDRIAFENPYFMAVRAAGNDRGEGAEPGEGHYVFQDGDWVFSTRTRPKDGGDDGFDTMGPVGTAKNVLAIGAIRDIPGGFDNPEDAEITSFSVFGPTDDGRIKPDVVANGERLYSTYSQDDADYGYSSGTSMASPSAAGSLALLQEHYYALNGQYMRSASLKGLVIHTADDGGNPGPDYKFGWGVMNTLKAAEIISNTEEPRITEHTLEEGPVYRIRLYSRGSEPIRVTLCWTDPPGVVPPATLDPADKILVNDLDLRVIRVSDGFEHMPFILDPVQPDKPATLGDNTRDNVEQVLIESGVKGFYEITVSHKGILYLDRQDYSLVVSGLDYKYFAAGETTLADNNGAFILTSAEEYLPDMQASWLIKPENGNPVSLYFDFLETEASADPLMVYDGSDTTAPLLAQLSGNLTGSDTILLASGNSIYVTFLSDHQVQDRGFKAIYCTEAPEGVFSIQGETLPCAGSTEDYIVSGSDGTGYHWLPPPGWELGVDGENSVSLQIGPENGLLEVIPFNRCGEAGSSALAIQPLSTPPVMSGPTGDTALCAWETGMLSMDSLPGAVYEWTLPDSWQGTGDSHTLSFIPSVDQGPVTVTARNSCGAGDTLEIPVRVNTIPPETQIFSAAGSICESTVNTFYLLPEEGTSYIWSVPPEWQIIGDNQNDTVTVQIGNIPNNVEVDASNECGSRVSSQYFAINPAPDMPLMGNSSSEYEGFRELEVQNASSFASIQWYRDGEMVPGPAGTKARYVTYIPGTYTVSVSNSVGCIYHQDPEDGIRITGPDQLFAVHAGPGGSIIVHNTTMEKATLSIYNTNGNILIIKEITPGTNRIPSRLKGVFIVSVVGQGNRHVSRIFIQ